MNDRPTASIPVRQEVFDRLALLKAKMSAREGRALDWDRYFERHIEGERKKREVLAWLYTVVIFAGVTFVLTSIFFGADPMTLPLFLVIGAAVAAASTYVLVPWSLHAFTPFTDAPPEIREAIAHLSDKAGITKRPQLMLVETEEVNAMTYPTLSGDHIVLTRGMVEAYQRGVFTLDELKAVLAHEIGHILHRDCFRASLILSWVSIFDRLGTFSVYTGSVMCRIAVALEGSSKERGNPGWVVGLGGWVMVMSGYVMKIIAKIAAIPAFHHSRRQEFAADEVGAELVSPGSMADALQKLKELQQRLVSKAVAPLPYAEQWQVEPANPSWIDRLYDTHPPLDVRQHRLRQIDAFLRLSKA